VVDDVRNRSSQNSRGSSLGRVGSINGEDLIDFEARIVLGGLLIEVQEKKKNQFIYKKEEEERSTKRRTPKPKPTPSNPAKRSYNRQNPGKPEDTSPRTINNSTSRNAVSRSI
jgi:hypothetical protein